MTTLPRTLIIKRSTFVSKMPLQTPIVHSFPFQTFAGYHRREALSKGNAAIWPFKGPSGFSSSSTAEEVTHGIDGSGLTAIVTGASSGMGLETARVLTLRGVHVVMAVRNVSAGEKVKEAIVQMNPSAKLDVMEMDLTSVASVRKFASDFNSSPRPLNLLINNAGVMGTPYMLSKDNIELQFATNYLGHFLLTTLLLDTMKKTARETKREGRIVNVASGIHRLAYKEGIRFDRLNDPQGYTRWGAYGQSKLASILHATELTRLFKEEGVDVTANSLHPGVVATNIFRHLGLLGAIAAQFKFLYKSVEQGASTTCYLALNPQVKGISGKYFSNNNLAKPASRAEDADFARKLWDFSTDLTN